MNADLATRFVGFCPVCEGQYKLHDGKLVHHGFKRPGDGMIHGDCFAVHMEPHEVSSKTAEAYKASCEKNLIGAKAYLAQLEAGEIKTFFGESYDHTRMTTYTPDRKVTKVMSTGEETVVTGLVAEYDFKQKLAEAIRKAEFVVKTLELDIERMNNHITTWTLKPVITFEESKAAEKAKKESSKGVKTAARQAKIAAKVESYQKRIDSAHKRAAKGGNGTLGDIWESIVYNYSGLGFKTPQDLLNAVDRNPIFTALGLDVSDREGSRDKIRDLRYGPR